MSQVSYGTITIVDTTDIERIYMVYAKSVSNTTPPSDELIWSESITSAPGEGDFIWQKTVVEKAITEEKTYSDPVCVTGSSGQGVEKIINYYCNYGQGQPEEDYSGWQLEIPEYDGNKPNYWTKVVVIYSDDTREDFQASGTIATFENEKVGVLDSLEVSLSPIQDLHGYDRPWVRGAGKNLFDPSYVNRKNEGITYAPTSDGKIEITGTAIASSFSAKNATNYENTWIKLKAGTYTLKTSGLLGDNKQGLYVGAFTASGESVTLYPFVYGDLERTFTVSEDFGIWYWIYTIKDAVVNTIVEIQLEEGPTATEWTPYSNICPISGWDEVETVVSGKNLCDNSVFGTYGLVEQSDGSWYADNNNKIYDKVVWQNDRGIEGQLAIVFKYRYSNADYVGAYPRVYYTDGTPQNLAVTKTTVPTEISTVTQSGKIVDRIVMVYSSNGAQSYVNLMVTEDLTATAYEPYQGHTYTTTIPQTVYGGTLDVVSGVLTVDRAMVDLGTLTWAHIAPDTANARFLTYGINTTCKHAPSNYQPSPYIISSQYEVMSINGAISQSAGMAEYTDGTVMVRDTRYNDAESFKTAMSGVQLVYELATPTTIQLTPTQIDSLLGRNNVWSDGTVEVEGHTISKKDIMIYKDNGLTDVANKSAEANTNAAEALEKANDGIISTTQLWYQTNGTSAPNVPTNHSQVDQGTVTYNNWRSVRPNNSVDSYKYYYYCYEYLHGDETYTYSAEAILDTSNLSQYQIEQLQTRVKKMWSNSTGSYMASGIGTKEIYIDNSSTYGFNSKSTTTGVSFNYNAIPLTSLGTDGIKLYSPTLTNGVITGSRLDAILDTNGLFLNRGGIESGGLSSGNGYVYLSTLDKAGITINGHLPGTNDPKWRAIIGSKFGVDSEGNLYANNANISGKITANSESNVYTIVETDKIIGDVYDKASETKIIKYAYSTTLSGDDLSLTNTELPYRGIYVGPVDETAFEDFDNYMWELNPVWASKYADQYLHSIEDGIAIYNSDLGSDTYAGLSATALTFFLANIEQMRVGYEASIDDYGVIASSLIALGSGAGIKFDNYGHTDEGARGRYVWEVRDNGHLSLKLF